MEEIRGKVQISGRAGRRRAMAGPSEARQHRRGEEERRPADRSANPPPPSSPTEQTEAKQYGHSEPQQPVLAELRTSQHNRYRALQERGPERLPAHTRRHYDEPDGARDDRQRQARPGQPAQPPAQSGSACRCYAGLPDCRVSDQTLEGEHSGQHYHRGEMKEARRNQRSFHCDLQASW